MRNYQADQCPAMSDENYDAYCAAWCVSEIVETPQALKWHDVYAAEAAVRAGIVFG